MRTPAGPSLLSELRLSPLPELRRAQVDMLVKMLNALERRQPERVMPWDSIARLAESAAVVEATDAWLAAAPTSDRFESFEDLAARRDDSGLVRLPR